MTFPVFGVLFSFSCFCLGFSSWRITITASRWQTCLFFSMRHATLFMGCMNRYQAKREAAQADGSSTFGITWNMDGYTETWEFWNNRAGELRYGVKSWYSGNPEPLAFTELGLYIYADGPGTGPFLVVVSCRFVMAYIFSNTCHSFFGWMFASWCL